MNPKIEIENLLHIEGCTAETRRAAADKLAVVATDIRTDTSGRLRFACEWDPPFKVLSAFAREHPGIRMTLWSDAFASHHWLCKAEIADDTCRETVVSRVDDAFDAIFEEVYQRSYSEWEKAPVAPFPETG